MELDVLSGSAEQLEEAVDDLVLAHPLVADQQQMFPQREVLHHVLHHAQVLKTQVGGGGGGGGGGVSVNVHLYGAQSLHIWTNMLAVLFFSPFFWCLGSIFV